MEAVTKNTGLTIGELNDDSKKIRLKIKNKIIETLKSSKPTDIMYFDPSDIERYSKFAVDETDKFDGDDSIQLAVSFPADIIFANTIPVKDLMLVENNDISFVSCRIAMLNDHDRNTAISRMINSEEIHCVNVGVIETTVKGDNGTVKAYMEMSVCDNSNLIETKWIGIELKIAGSEEDMYENLNGMEQLGIIYDMNECINRSLIVWYALQQCLLNPVLSNYVSTRKEPLEQINKKQSAAKNKKKRKPAPKRYIKRNTILLDKMDNEVSINYECKSKKKTPLWHVTGHWREYKTGKKIFIQGYWKGPLREYKNLDEPREREIAG